MAKPSPLVTSTAMLEDLKRSGLTAADAKLMQLTAVTAEECDERYGIPRSGYDIPYFDIDGKRVPEMVRTRFLDAAQPRKFGGKSVTVDQIKYMQPPSTRPYAYFSKRVGWRTVLNNKDTPILFN